MNSNQGDTFHFRGHCYEYFHHSYNTTRSTERAVEIPIVSEVVKTYRGKRVLEVGNVLSHYFEVAHTVLDKYEQAPGVINLDVVEFKPLAPFDLIISISTLEHIGWDEQPRQPDKILLAMNILTGCLAVGGKMIVTLPLGYNTNMDRLLAGNTLRFDECYGMKRISATDWVQVNWAEALGSRYGTPFPYANGIIIGIVCYK